MELYDVDKKLTGPINPIGETQEDERRLKNLKATFEIVDNLLTDIYIVTVYKDRPEHSMQKAGELADKFYKSIRN